MATKLKPKKVRLLPHDEKAVRFPLSYPPETVPAENILMELWEIVLRVLNEQPVSTRRRPYLLMICDEINSHHDNEPYHVMTMNDVCYIIKKPEKG